MRIKYKVSMEDLMAFSQFWEEHSAFVKRQKMVYGIIFPAGMFIFFCIEGLRKGRWDMPVVGGVFGVAFMLWILGGRRRRLGKITRKILSEGSNKGTLGEHELEMTEAGFFSRGEYGEGRFSWDVVERIGFTPDYTFIFVGAAKGLSIAKASVLEGDYEAFRDELRQRFEEKVKAEGVQQSRDLSKRVITDTQKIYKEDTGFGKHSGHGIASFVTAMGTVALDALLFGLVFIWGLLVSEEVHRGSVVLRMFGGGVMLGLAANVVGVVLGIVGLCRKNRKKLFAILGIILNLIIVIGFGVLLRLRSV